MDFAIVVSVDGKATGEMTFDQSENGNLMNNVWLSLSVKKGSFFQNPDFGLKDRGRMKNTERTAAIVVDDFRDALQWIVDTKKAKKIDVFAERDRTQDLHRLKILVAVTPVSGDAITFTRFVEVV
jgi:phage gp46-like protein